MSESARRRATVEDLWAIPADERFHELIDGELSEKLSPSGEHSDAQGGIIGALRGPFHRSTGNGGAGGWWIYPEVEVQLGSDIVRPDIVGWRRETMPARPTGFPQRQRPDWICEVISPEKPTRDTVKKLRLYHHAEIPFYWLVDPTAETLTAMRWSDAGYITLLIAERGEVVRAQPFDAIELAVGTLFGDDPPT